MEPLAPLLPQPGVGNVLRQRVLDCIPWLWNARLLIEKISYLQVIAQVLELLLGLIRHLRP
jgi:hypothetical protein